MGAKKLIYDFNPSPLRVVYKSSNRNEKSVQRFLSLDPLMRKFPSMSPFVAFDNNPIYFTDPYGLESGKGSPDDSGQKGDPPKTGKGEEDFGGGKSESTFKMEEGYSKEIGNNNGVDGGKSVSNQKYNVSIAQTSNNTGASSSPPWGSQYGCYVHQAANRVAVYGINNTNTGKVTPKRYLDDEKAEMVLSQLDAATVYADGAKFQTGKYAFRHAMSPSNKHAESVEKANKFVRKQFNAARKSLKKGNAKLAYFQLGVAIHTIQDATSPAHGGWQIWNGDETLLEQAHHCAQELMYPGSDSELQRVTDWMLDLLEFGGELPEGDIFKTIKIDE